MLKKLNFAFIQNYNGFRRCDKEAQQILSCDKNERIYQKFTQRVTFAFLRNEKRLTEILEALIIARKRGLVNDDPQVLERIRSIQVFRIEHNSRLMFVA